MLSEETEQRLLELYEKQDGYQPAADIKARLSGKYMVMFVGATCVGKNTIMDIAARLDTHFSICGTFTSREPRESDNKARYTYYENSDQGLAKILERIDAGQVVQYAVNPYAKLLYGSELSDYPAIYSLGDFFSSAVTGFRQLGFKKALAITVVTDPASWLQRFNERFPLGHEHREARRDEAIESFTWSLAQTDDHFWVENIDKKPEIAAQTAIDIALDSSAGQPEARVLAEACLAAAKGIRI